MPKTRSNKLSLSRQQVFVGHSDKCVTAMEEGGGAGQQTLSAASQEGSLECRAVTCPGFQEEDNDETVADVVSFQPRFLQSRLALRERHRPARTNHSADLGGSYFFKVATPCMDDHQFTDEENQSVGELSTVCSQIVLKCLFFLAHNGRRDI